jgi:hypothetical protein
MKESAVTESVKHPVPNLHRPPSICLKYQIRSLFCRHRRALHGKLRGYGQDHDLADRQSDGSFRLAQNFRFPRSPISGTIVDLNRDGFPDLILADFSDNNSCSKVDDCAQTKSPVNIECVVLPHVDVRQRLPVPAE